MPKHSVTILGLLVAALPFLGFPSAFKSPAYFVLGIVIAYIGYYEHRHKRKPFTVRRIRKARDITAVQVTDAPIRMIDEKESVVSNLMDQHEEVNIKT